MSNEQANDRKKFESTREWLQLQYHNDNKSILKPDELSNLIEPPPMIEGNPDQDLLLKRITGSMLGMTIGDALGAHVEFRPRDYLLQHPVKDFEAGGTWGLARGQFTDDTSMALCLANSLIVCQGFNPYDQLVRYKWWYRKGYMSSTGHCFDIGNATKYALNEFQRRQRDMQTRYSLKDTDVDYEQDPDRLKDFNVYCSDDNAAGNGALSRLAPVPIFFHRDPPKAVEYSGVSGRITHGDIKVYDSCRYYGALIVAALQGDSKERLLDEKFYSKHEDWFGGKKLVPEIMQIADGSYKKRNGYEDGIRGKGYTVNSLEAALWAFWSTDTFEEGALAAVNLGDDTDTTAAIYGQLAGAYYTSEKLPRKWVDGVCARKFIVEISKWLRHEGERFVCGFREMAVLSTVSSTKIRPEIKFKSASVRSSTSVEANTPVTENYVIDGKNCLQWSCEDVCRWLKSLGPIYGNYVDAFRMHNIDGRRLLKFVDKDTLHDLGITGELAQRVVCDGIEILKSQYQRVRSKKDELYQQFVDDDYAPPFHLHDRVYGNTKSCVLSSDQENKQVYKRILQWIGDLPEDIEIEKIELVHNRHRYRAFLQQILSAEQKQTQSDFQPDLARETNPSERRRVLQRLEKLTKQVTHRRSVPIARVWHGCQREAMLKIVPDGFAGLSELDDGWFGKGMYFTSSAKYAATYAGSRGCLIMCYVIVLNPFPVITDDAPPRVSSEEFRFYAHGHHANYQCHYIPVVPMEPDTNFDFRPPPRGVQDALFDEFVMFQQTDILHQVVVHLKPKT